MSCNLWEQRCTVVHTEWKVCECVCVGVTAGSPATLINKRIPLDNSPEHSYHTAFLSTRTARTLRSVHVRWNAEGHDYKGRCRKRYESICMCLKLDSHQLHSLNLAKMTTINSQFTIYNVIFCFIGIFLHTFLRGNLHLKQNWFKPGKWENCTFIGSW